MIPRRFHWIWLGERPLPSQIAAWIERWMELHPGWEQTVWTDANRPRLRNEEQFRAAANPAQQSDVLRYELVLDHGGVYLDCDVQCYRSIDPLIGELDAFVGRENDEHVGNAIFGAIPGHAWLQAAVDRLPGSFAGEWSQVAQAGPGLMTAVTEGRSDVTIFPPAIFCPWRASRADAPAYTDAYAIHHCVGSWRDRSAEHVWAALEINEIVPPGAEVMMITDGDTEFELPERVVTELSQPPYPADAAEAVSWFERRRTPALKWVIFHRFAFWWLAAYPEFRSFLESASTRVERRRWIVAFELPPA